VEALAALLTQMASTCLDHAVALIVSPPEPVAVAVESALLLAGSPPQPASSRARATNPALIFMA
jgi:hypothetical protein